MPGHRKADRGRTCFLSEDCVTITIDAPTIRQFIEA
jgi:hypothetical protein